MRKLHINETNYTFKILYCIGIILVVCGHCNNGGLNLFFDWFPPYGFHLALFVFSSGYFYKKNNENSICDYIVKKVKRLLIPVFLWNIFYGILTHVLSFKGFKMGEKLSLRSLFISPVLHGHQFIFNLGGWFIIPLFMVETLNIVLRKCLSFIKEQNVKDCIYILIFTTAGIFGTYYSQFRENDLQLVLFRMLHFLPFYAFGFFYRYYLENNFRIPSLVYFSVIFSLTLLIKTKYPNSLGFEQSWCKFGNHYILPYIIGVLGIMFWLRIAKMLTPILGKNKIINEIADNTFSITINHFIGFMIVKTYFAFCAKLFKCFTDFDFIAYKTDIWYYYLPYNIWQFSIVYVVVGIVVSLYMQKTIIVIKNIFYKLYKKHHQHPKIDFLSI